MVGAINGRLLILALEPGTVAVPFVADPAPQEVVGVIPWAVRQFEALQRALKQMARSQDLAALEARVEALEGEVSVLQTAVADMAGIVGDGSWDGPS